MEAAAVSDGVHHDLVTTAAFIPSIPSFPTTFDDLFICQLAAKAMLVGASFDSTGGSRPPAPGSSSCPPSRVLSSTPRVM